MDLAINGKLCSLIPVTFARNVLWPKKFMTVNYDARNECVCGFEDLKSFKIIRIYEYSFK